MDQYLPNTKVQIEIIDREGGLRSVKELNYQQKRFTYIGSDPKNDICLGQPGNEKGVTPKHLQVIVETGDFGTGQTGLRCKAVNLSGSPIEVSASSISAPSGQAQSQLARLSAMVIAGEERLSLGAYDLVFHLGDFQATSEVTPFQVAPFQAAAYPAADTSYAEGVKPGTGGTIRLRIELPRRPLTPANPLDGRVYVMNMSSRRDVQVTLKLEGLPPECFTLGQAPLLYPGAEQDVNVHINHPGIPKIAPGPLKITISAEMGEGDTRETVSASQEIIVSAFCSHSIHLIRLERGD